MTGDELAASMGVNVQRTRKGLFAIVALLTATLVAWTGTIGFVGLIILIL
nr:iron chelate uptake ABC transporter family permease subunit [Photobacterium sanguinicancri]